MCANLFDVPVESHYTSKSNTLTLRISLANVDYSSIFFVWFSVFGYGTCVSYFYRQLRPMCVLFYHHRNDNIERIDVSRASPSI